MQTINITSIGAASTVASTIEGYGGPLVLADPEVGATVLLRADREYTEIEFRGDFVSTARVMIERPHVDPHRGLTGTTVTWSSSDSRTVGCGDAIATARLLAFAGEVARVLDDWVEEGQLSRLTPDSEPTS